MLDFLEKRIENLLKLNKISCHRILAMDFIVWMIITFVSVFSLGFGNGKDDTDSDSDSDSESESKKKTKKYKIIGKLPNLKRRHRELFLLIFILLIIMWRTKYYS